MSISAESVKICGRPSRISLINPYFCPALNFHHFILLLKKEFDIEFRQKTAINGILLFVLSTVFISYLAFQHIIEPSLWNALFWIILLFGAIITVSKSFLNEQKGRMLYNYFLYNPRTVILSKIVYNSILLTVVSFVTLFLFSVFIGSPVQDLGVFSLVLFLASFGFSSILTLMAGISIKAGGSFTLTAILSFPLTVPLLLVAIKVSKYAIDGLAFSVCSQYLLVLLLLNIIVGALSYLLFPYLWSD
jgi:heme exporter protein B